MECNCEGDVYLDEDNFYRCLKCKKIIEISD